MIRKVATFLIIAGVLTTCKNENTKQDKKIEIDKTYLSLEKPDAKKNPDTLVAHNHKRLDNYSWMRLSDEQKKSKTPDTQTKDVLDYLNTENEYLSMAMKHTETLQNKLFKEINDRIKENDQSVPYIYNGYEYYTRFEEGEDYALNCRKKQGTSNEEIYLNAPKLASGKKYFRLANSSISQNNQILAYATDTVSRNQNTIYFKDLKTNTLFKDVLDNTSGNFVWANDSKTIFYLTKDPQTLRNNKVYKHILGTLQSQDILVFEEKDETFNCTINKSKSDDYIFINSDQTVSSEIRYINANKPYQKWQIIQPGERDLKYRIDQYQDHFYIRTNHNARNFKLVKTPISSPSKSNWQDVIAHQEDGFLQNFEIFKNFLVLNERKNGLLTLRVKAWDGSDEHDIAFEEPTYTSYIGLNKDFNTNKLRYTYTSFTTPTSTFEYDMKTKQRDLLKQDEVLGGFDSGNYKTERLFAPTKDGVEVPISIAYKKGIDINKNTPLLIYGYGSYGNSMSARFWSNWLSLLDRGFILALAHIRGGQEMGYHWYENGKLLNKKNTFTDFIDAAKHLNMEGYSSSDHMYALGASAGGLLMGAVSNMEPELFNGIVAAVPFVDVVSTMLDESIPLTTFEFDEWGNPKNKEYYDYMLSYSPYDNVVAKDYPHMLVTTGFWDSQVQYWEPAKWVAKLRELKTDDNILMMDCNMDAGHGGASGRFKTNKTYALYFAFMLNLEGIGE